VTPPLVGLAFKELLLLWGGSDGKSNADGGDPCYRLSAISYPQSVLRKRILALSALELRFSVAQGARVSRW